MTGQSRTAIDLVLAESFKELSQTRPIEKITIKEITDKAGVIRPTFYNHFQDKYELMEWIITTELLQPMHPLIQAGMVTEAMVLMFTNIEKEKAFYTKAVKMEGVITFHEIAMKCAKELLVEIFTERKGDKEPAHKWLTVDIVAPFRIKPCSAKDNIITIYINNTLFTCEFCTAISACRICIYIFLIRDICITIEYIIGRDMY